MSAAQRGIVEPVFRQPADLEILDQHVGIGGQRAHLRLALGALEIDRDRLLAAVAGVEIGAPARRRRDEGRSPCARIVAGARPLDLDHLGAEIGEQLPGPGPGEDPRQLERP